MLAWLIGLLDSWLVHCLLACLVSWLVAWSVGWLVGWLIACLFGLLGRWLVARVVGWLVSWFAFRHRTAQDGFVLPFAFLGTQPQKRHTHTHPASAMFHPGRTPRGTTGTPQNQQTGRILFGLPSEPKGKPRTPNQTGHPFFGNAFGFPFGFPAKPSKANSKAPTRPPLQVRILGWREKAHPPRLGEGFEQETRRKATAFLGVRPKLQDTPNCFFDHMSKTPSDS